ncbi:MAG: DNA polymerase III subunit delta' [Myxococcota bacterium]
MILGHAAAWASLRAAIARDGLHHALMFEGPRGVGKRALATALAQAANCAEVPPGSEACGACPTCRQIASGTHPDVIAVEPDPEKAARTISIESIREVIRQSQYHRFSARARFVIVDPAEAMQEPAANALLKTLEEPPAGTHFVVITHNARGLLPTILSRCQRIRLGAVPLDAIEAWLGSQGLPNAGEAARLSQGCPGRARALAESGFAERASLRASLLAAVQAPLADVYAFSTQVTQGARQEWAGEVDQLLELVEDLVRDAAIVAAGASVPTVDAVDPVVERLASTWPHGITACQRAIAEARDDLEVYVTGKTVIDALITAIRRELHAAPLRAG